MEIEYLVSPKIQFDDLKIGDLFEFCDDPGSACLKTGNITFFNLSENYTLGNTKTHFYIKRLFGKLIVKESEL